MSNIVKKIVNVHPTTAIYGLTIPILGDVLNVELPVGDIRTAIVRGARVEEVIGKNTVALDLSNYDKNNRGSIIVVEEEVKEPVVETLTQGKIDTVDKAGEVVKTEEPKAVEVKAAEEVLTKVETKNTKSDEEPIVAKDMNQVSSATIEKASKKINNFNNKK